MAARKTKKMREPDWSDLSATRVDSVPSDGWVRLFASSSLEAEEARWLGRGPGGEELFEIDRKLARDTSIFCLQGRQFYFADSFIDYLIRARVTGWSESALVRHFTPNEINGRPFYRVRVEGELGTIHESTRTKASRVNRDNPGFVPGMLERQIFEPVTIDGARWTGHDLCLSSQWLQGYAVWRALFIRVEALRRVPPPEDLFLNPVNVVNLASPRRRPRFVAPDVEVPELPPRRSIAEVWAGLMLPFDFKVPPKRAPMRKILAELKAVGLDGVPELVELLKLANGSTLFEHGLIFASVGHPDWSLPAMKAEDYGYEFPDGWSPFAYAHRGAIAWGCSREGKVRGFGREGITYGPNVSVAEWLSDQIADLRWTLDHIRSYSTILGM